MVADVYGIRYIYFPVAYYHLNLDVAKENLLAAGFSAVPAVFLVLDCYRHYPAFQSLV